MTKRKRVVEGICRECYGINPAKKVCRECGGTGRVKYVVEVDDGQDEEEDK